MPEIVTTEDVQEARARVEALREQKAELEAEISANAQSSTNEYRVATLNAEAMTLEQEVERLKELASPEAQERASSVITQVAETVVPEANPADVVVTDEAAAAATATTTPATSPPTAPAPGGSAPAGTDRPVK